MVIVTHIVASGEAEVVEQIVRNRVGDVASIDVQSGKHHTNPDLRKSNLLLIFRFPFRTRALTIIFQSTLRLTAFSSLYVQRNEGSKAE